MPFPKTSVLQTSPESNEQVFMAHNRTVLTYQNNNSTSTFLYIYYNTYISRSNSQDVQKHWPTNDQISLYNNQYTSKVVSRIISLFHTQLAVHYLLVIYNLTLLSSIHQPSKYNLQTIPATLTLKYIHYHTLRY